MYQSLGRSSRPRLEVAAALAMVAAAFLPFAAFNFNFGDSSARAFGFDYSISVPLTQLVGETDTGGLGASYLILVAGAAAFVAALYRAVQPWPQVGSAAACLLGFAGFTGGAVWLMAQIVVPGSSTEPSDLGLPLQVGFVPSVGFWAEVVIGSFGALICLVNLVNPVRQPPGFNAVGGGGVPLSPWPPAPYPPYPPYPPPYPTPPYPAPPYPAPPYPAASPWQPPAAPAAAAEPREPSAAKPGAGLLTVSEGGRMSSYDVAAGKSMSIGRDPEMDIRLGDPHVGARQLVVTFTNTGWTVRVTDLANPTQVLEPSGTTRTLYGELSVPAAHLLVGSSLVVLAPPTPG